MLETKTILLQKVEMHLLMVSLVRLNREINKVGLDARIVAYIHDAIWVETGLAQESEVRRITEETMKTAVSLAVPMLVDFEH